MKTQLFTIVPGSNGPLWMLAGISVMLLLMVALFAWLAYSSRHTRFEVSAEGLQISSTMYGRMIPASALVVDAARVLDLGRDRQYRPKWKTNGSGLPGYQAGWFKLHNGEKSLLFVTDRKRVVYVPTNDGYSVLMSVKQPEQFVAALQNTRLDN
jgi:hypothetical protein